jgi:hypothetical protein
VVLFIVVEVALMVVLLMIGAGAGLPPVPFDDGVLSTAAGAFSFAAF